MKPVGPEPRREGLGSKSAGKGDKSGGRSRGLSADEVEDLEASMRFLGGVDFFGGEIARGVESEFCTLEDGLPLACCGLRDMFAGAFIIDLGGSILALFSG